jgi:hypothetical protein
MKVINEDGTSITTKVTVKQLHYIPITPRLKQLILCEEKGATNEVAQGRDT